MVREVPNIRSPRGREKPDIENQTMQDTHLQPQEDAWFSQDPQEYPEAPELPSWYGKDQFATLAEESGKILKGGARALNLMPGKEHDAYAQNIKDLPKSFLEAPKDILKAIHARLFEQSLNKTQIKLGAVISEEVRAIKPKSELLGRVLSVARETLKTAPSFFEASGLQDLAQEHLRIGKGIFGAVFQKNTEDPYVQKAREIPGMLRETARDFLPMLLDQLANAPQDLQRIFQDPLANSSLLEERMKDMPSEESFAVTTPAERTLEETLHDLQTCAEETRALAIGVKLEAKNLELEHTRFFSRQCRSLLEQRMRRLIHEAGASTQRIQETLNELEEKISSATAIEGVEEVLINLQKELLAHEKREDLAIRYYAEHLSQRILKLPEGVLTKKEAFLFAEKLQNNPNQETLKELQQNLEEYIAFLYTQETSTKTPEEVELLQEDLQRNIALFETIATAKLRGASRRIQEHLATGARNLMRIAS